MTTTTDLANFGHREREMAEKLLKAWREQGLPQDFDNEEVTIMMNQDSGNVFLTNDEYQTAMITVGGKLKSFYNTPYEGHEGFFSELLEELDDSWHKEDVEYLMSIAQTDEDKQQIIKKAFGLQKGVNNNDKQ